MTGITQNVGISIHAPVKGATVRVARIQAGAPNFNPRSREGSDAAGNRRAAGSTDFNPRSPRSEEHTSELQSRENLVCRLLREKKKKNSM